jgi:hypothetical protein
MLEKLERKYGWKGLEIGNIFSYRNFSRFELDLELKIWKIKIRFRL